MTPTVLIAFATKHGSTRDVATEIAGRLCARGIVTYTCPAADVETIDGFDGVVFGSALYLGRLHPDGRDFLRRFRVELTTRRFAVFALGPRTLDDGDVASSRRQLEAALAKEPPLRPFATAVFGGVFDPAQHRFPLSRMPASDARAWSAIHAWADEIAGRFSTVEAAATGTLALRLAPSASCRSASAASRLGHACFCAPTRASGARTSSPSWSASGSPTRLAHR